MGTLALDVRYALRQFRQRPGLPLVIVLSLAFGIGVSTSMFSVVTSIWFRPWPVRDAASLRVISPETSIDDWRVWREQTRAFSGLAAQERRLARARLGSQLISLDFVSTNYFQVLNVPMLVGRGFAPEDSLDGANTVVIGHHLWQTRLGGDGNVIGRRITVEPVDRRLKSVSFTVDGVAAQGFDGPDILRTQLWLPLAASPLFQDPGTEHGSGSATALRVTAFGHLATGVSDKQAEAELVGLIGRVRQLRPQERVPAASLSVHSTARYANSSLSLETRLMWGSLLIGIVFITLIACANVTNLMLARGHARRVEMAVRLALGASRARIIRQLLTESVMLCLVAAICGIAIASWLPEAIYEALVQNTSPDLANTFQLSFPIDGRVVIFGFVMCAIACVAFGLAPAFRCSDVGSGEMLKEGHGIATGALMPSLLSYQAIVSVMALAIAGLMLRSGPVSEARTIKRSVADLTAVVLNAQGLDRAQYQMLIAETSERLAAVSGGQRVAGITGQMQAGISQTLKVTANYFDVVQIPWTSGRTFGPSDPRDHVMVVNETFARRFWPGTDAIGQILSSDDVWDPGLVGRQVVGVVGNTQLLNPTAYLPAELGEVRVLLVRAPQPRVSREVARFIASRHPSVSTDILSGPVWIATAIGPSMVVADMTMYFGGVALVLGAVGLFSFMQFSVQQRTGEIALRRALGARSWDVVRSLVEPAARPLVRALLMGSAGAVSVGVFMRKAELPAGINPLDLVTYAGVTGVMAVAFLLAAYGPARRAITTEPNKLLRS